MRWGHCKVIRGETGYSLPFNMVALAAGEK